MEAKRHAATPKKVVDNPREMLIKFKMEVMADWLLIFQNCLMK